jgi:hypothetical protein
MLRVRRGPRLSAPRAHPISRREEAKEVRARKFDAYLGSNHTCEIALNLATCEDYGSFVFLLEELTREANGSVDIAGLKRSNNAVLKFTRVVIRAFSFLKAEVQIRRCHRDQ